MRRIFTLLAFGGTLLVYSCDGETLHCGNEVLDNGEQCDGVLFKEGFVQDCPEGTHFAPGKAVCTDICEVDLLQSCVKSVCGNGVLEAGEECDISEFMTLDISCESGSPDYSKKRCTDACVVDYSEVCSAPQALCNNGQLDAGEDCDGTKFNESKKVCPEDMQAIPGGDFLCSACKMDISQACEPKPPCGNGRLDTGEECDGELYSMGSKACDVGSELVDEKLFACTEQCTLDKSQACKDTVRIMFTEYAAEATEEEVIGFAFEFSYLAKDTAPALDLSACSISALDRNGKNIFPTTLSGSLEPGQQFVACSSESATPFGGKCQYTFPDNYYVKNAGDIALVQLSCAGEIKDFAPFASIGVGARWGVTTGVRHCDAKPVTEPKKVSLDIGWYNAAAPVLGPANNLGLHCTAYEKELTDCKLSTDLTNISSVEDILHATAQLKIPSLSDKSNGLDIDSGVITEVRYGTIKGSSVEFGNFRVFWLKGDPATSNNEGYDQCVGEHKNNDVFTSFIPITDNGSYTADLAVSLDNGKTFTLCGSKGILTEAENYVADERITIEVLNNCSNKVLDSGEECDGTAFDESKKVCDAGTTLVAQDKFKCVFCKIDKSEACQ